MKQQRGATLSGADHVSPWLSILVPVYNVAPYLRQCIDSILQQIPARGVEVILLDDASTDSSRQICAELCAAHGATVRLLTHETNSGPSAARNNLLEAAAGTYIWFVDSDDQMLPNAIVELQAVTSRHAPDMVLCNFRRLGKEVDSFAGPERILSTDREALIRGLFMGRCMHSWARVSRRALWGADLRFPVGRFFEDVMTTPWLCLRANSFFYVGKSWISYRVRTDSIMGSVTRTPGFFDNKKMDDLAVALAGFVAEARASLPGLTPKTAYAIAAYCEKEFSKICRRLLKARFLKDAWQSIVAQIRRYQVMTERDSPLPYARLASCHLRHGRVGRWLTVRLILLVTARFD